jgi:intracellular multiplication protein IcmV
MALKDIFKISRKTFFNPGAWLGYDYVKDSTLYFWQAIKNIFVPQKAGTGRKETFEEAMKRQKLTEADVQQSAKNYLIYTLIFIALAVFTAFYGFYLLIEHKEWIAWILSMALVALLLSQAFRFHFWYFQIKHRKLGCTLREWWHGKINTKESTP